MSRRDVVDNLFSLLEENGRGLYGESGVNQIQHALQAASQAEQAGSTDEMITAALLHDIGHLIDNDAAEAQLRGEDRRHEDLGSEYLSAWFGPEVTEPIRLHVPAKRYLVYRKDQYADRLSEASIRTLELQGGAFETVEQAAEFEAERFFQDAVRLRVWDEGAKSEDAATPDLAHYRPIVERAIKVEAISDF